jgi:hypothetical protein
MVFLQYQGNGKHIIIYSDLSFEYVIEVDDFTAHIESIRFNRMSKITIDIYNGIRLSKYYKKIIDNETHNHLLKQLTLILIKELQKQLLKVSK